jgi:hypothetical protein
MRRALSLDHLLAVGAISFGGGGGLGWVFFSLVSVFLCCILGGTTTFS